MFQYYKNMTYHPNNSYIEHLDDGTFCGVVKTRVNRQITFYLNLYYELSIIIYD